jgi:hypothetical protein
MQYECMMSCNVSALYVPHQKKRLAKYRWCTCSQWQFVLNPVVSFSGMTYTNVVSIPAEEHNIHELHHPTERYLHSYLVVGASL